MDDSHFRQRAYAAAIILNETGGDKMIMKSFVQAYGHRFNELLTEKGIFDMKHAINITCMNGVKFVCMTPLMKLLMRVGHLLENETFLNICEIKTALDLSLTCYFEMGENLMCETFVDYFFKQFQKFYRLSKPFIVDSSPHGSFCVS